MDTAFELMDNEFLIQNCNLGTVRKNGLYEVFSDSLDHTCRLLRALCTGEKSFSLRHQLAVTNFCSKKLIAFIQATSHVTEICQLSIPLLAHLSQPPLASVCDPEPPSTRTVKTITNSISSLKMRLSSSDCHVLKTIFAVARKLCAKLQTGEVKDELQCIETVSSTLLVVRNMLLHQESTPTQASTPGGQKEPVLHDKAGNANFLKMLLEADFSGLLRNVLRNRKANDWSYIVVQILGAIFNEQLSLSPTDLCGLHIDVPSLPSPPKQKACGEQRIRTALAPTSSAPAPPGTLPSSGAQFSRRAEDRLVHELCWRQAGPQASSDENSEAEQTACASRSGSNTAGQRQDGRRWQDECESLADCLYSLDISSVDATCSSSSSDDVMSSRGYAPSGSLDTSSSGCGTQSNSSRISDTDSSDAPSSSMHQPVTANSQRNRISQFTLEFVRHGFAPLASCLRRQLESGAQSVDETYLVWLLSYFLPYTRALDAGLQHTREILTPAMVSAVLFTAYKSSEVVSQNHRKGLNCSSALSRERFSVKALRQLLLCLRWSERYWKLSDLDQQHLRMLKEYLVTTRHCRLLLVYLIRRCRSLQHSRLYLQELVLTNHYLLVVLEQAGCSSGTLAQHLRLLSSPAILHQYRKLLQSSLQPEVQVALFTLLQHCAEQQPLRVLELLVEETTEEEALPPQMWEDLYDFVERQLMFTSANNPLQLAMQLINGSNIDASSWIEESEHHHSHIGENLRDLLGKNADSSKKNDCQRSGEGFENALVQDKASQTQVCSPLDKLKKQHSAAVDVLVDWLKAEIFAAAEAYSGLDETSFQEPLFRLCAMRGRALPLVPWSEELDLLTSKPDVQQQLIALGLQCSPLLGSGHFWLPRHWRCAELQEVAAKLGPLNTGWAAVMNPKPQSETCPKLVTDFRSSSEPCQVPRAAPAPTWLLHVQRANHSQLS